MKINFCSFPGTLILLLISGMLSYAQPHFTGKYFSGEGDTTYLQLLDKAYRMTRPDPELENLSMLYHPAWNGFVEGPTWDAWWIQNSFGPSYTLLPFMDAAYRQFVENSQELWFNQIGNGIRKDANGYCAPSGSLCDCARPGWVIFKQGDGRHKIHDWAYGFTAAGIILQSELLLIKRDQATMAKYLPLLEQCVEFLDDRRDKVKNVFLVGPAGNLLAPSYAGSGKQLPDGTFEKAYLTEISVNYIAGLNRMIELEKMLARVEKVKLYESRKAKVLEGLKWLTTDEGYFVRAREVNGTIHGKYGDAKYGYFEAAPNHDALAFRVVDDTQTRKIYEKIKSIPGIRPNKLILPNYPGYDDMYDTKGLFTYGTWINGGHWTTCEARMQLGYYRVGAFQDAADGFRQILKLAPIFRLDNNLTNFGADLYQPKLPINCVYDSWGAPGGFMRGLFEYEYLADGLKIYPHIPTGISRLEQSFPVYFGKKKIFFQTSGNGAISSITINGKPLEHFDAKSFLLKLDANPGIVKVAIGLGTKNTPAEFQPIVLQPSLASQMIAAEISDLAQGYTSKSGPIPSKDQINQLKSFVQKLESNELTDSYEFAHASLVLESAEAIRQRIRLKEAGRLVSLPEASQKAADQLYLDAITKLYGGLKARISMIQTSSNQKEQQISSLWKETNAASL